jgi:hypothetical protein
MLLPSIQSSCTIRWRDRIPPTSDQYFDPRSASPSERTFEVLSSEGHRIGHITFVEFCETSSCADSPWGPVRQHRRGKTHIWRIQCPDGVSVEVRENLSHTRVRVSFSTGHQYTLRSRPLSWNMTTARKNTEGACVLFDGVFDEQDRNLEEKGLLRGIREWTLADKHTAKSGLAPDRAPPHSSSSASRYYHQWSVSTWGTPEPQASLVCSLSLMTAHRKLEDILRTQMVSGSVIVPSLGR